MKKNISKLSLQIFFIFQNSKYLEITQLYPKSDGILKKKVNQNHNVVQWLSHWAAATWEVRRFSEGWGLKFCLHWCHYSAIYAFRSSVMGYYFPAFFFFLLLLSVMFCFLIFESSRSQVSRSLSCRRQSLNNCPLCPNVVVVVVVLVVLFCLPPPLVPSPKSVTLWSGKLLPSSFDRRTDWQPWMCWQFLDYIVYPSTADPGQERGGGYWFLANIAWHSVIVIVQVKRGVGG